MNLKQFIFNRFLTHQPQREKAYPDWEKVNSVFLLFDSEWTERNTDIRAIVQQLHDQNKQVMSWSYLKKDKILSPNLPESRILGPKEFNVFQRPRPEVKQFVQSHEFDVLIDLTATPQLPLQYIAALANAKFKIGAHEAPYYDMAVLCAPDATKEYIFQQIVHYLSIIKSVD